MQALSRTDTHSKDNDMKVKDIKKQIIKEDYLEDTKQVVSNVIDEVCRLRDIEAIHLLTLQLFADDVDGYFLSKNEEKAHGQILVSEKGQVQKNPAVRIAYDYRVNIDRFIKDYGLTPLTNKRLRDNQPTQGDDPLSEFLNNK